MQLPEWSEALNGKGRLLITKTKFKNYGLV